MVNRLPLWSVILMGSSGVGWVENLGGFAGILCDNCALGWVVHCIPFAGHLIVLFPLSEWVFQLGGCAGFGVDGLNSSGPK